MKAVKENGGEIHKSMHYSIAWSEEDDVFIGRVAEFPSLAAHGDTPDAALHEIMTVVKMTTAD